jgi:hypothetical protein
VFLINIYMLYLTSFFLNIIDSQSKNVKVYQTTKELIELTTNNPVDAIAIDFPNNNYPAHATIIDQLENCCDQLFVYFSEPTTTQQNSCAPAQSELVNLLQNYDRSNITFFSDTVLNFKLVNSVHYTIINWFIDPINYYATKNWAKQSMNNLNTKFNKTHMIDVLLGTTKPHRNLVSALWENSQINDKMIYSYYRTNLNKGIDWEPLLHLDNHTHSSELSIIEDSPVRISAVLPTMIYNQSYYSAVVETIDTNEYSQYTEKVAKPIVAKRPFIVFTGQYYLKNLKILGFKTFDSIIDETYDNISDLNLRYLTAWQQVEWLCQQDPESIISQLEPILEYNKQHFLKTDWNFNLKRELKRYL